MLACFTYVVHLTTTQDLVGAFFIEEDIKICDNWTSMLTSAISYFANCNLQQAMFPATLPWPMTGSGNSRGRQQLKKAAMGAAKNAVLAVAGAEAAVEATTTAAAVVAEAMAVVVTVMRMGK